ncbi:hypothetical protein [Burkholderia contaminans]|uniref:hypothetical protein n=1 Tax=Burkholderia contaminans TaxID=488447 RepID=UPI0015819651|nr:hypothetical protein [Burkholderia contaminans]
MLHTTPGKGAGSVNGECQAKSAEFAAAIRKWRHQKNSHAGSIGIDFQCHSHHWIRLNSFSLTDKQINEK